MRKLFILLAILSLQITLHAQLTTPPNGGNKKVIVSERIGITDVTIHYDRPGVKGREGKIWGTLVHEGFTDLGFGTSKAAPWRAGANENTTIEFSTDVMVEGKPLKAGRYGLFVAYNPSSSTVIFSNNSTAWGSFFYNEKEDALRVSVKPIAADSNVEWLKYEFTNEKENSAIIALEWEKLIIPFKVEVDYIQTQLASFRRELQSNIGFQWQSYQQAAQFTVDNNVDLEEGLQWADYAVSGSFIGEENFVTLSTKAQILNKLNRNKEADSLMKRAIPLAKVNELHGYARQLLAQQKNDEAFKVFKINYDKHPNTFTTNMGMARAYSAKSNYKEALKYAQTALQQAPDVANKSSVENIIFKLKEGKDINQ